MVDQSDSNFEFVDVLVDRVMLVQHRMGFDLMYSLRTLLHRPGFALLAVLTLATGLGGAVSLFSFINAWMIEPLPFDQPSRLTHIRSLDIRRSDELGVSLADLSDFRRQAQTLESIGAWTFANYTLSALETEPERIRGSEVSTNFFDLLGVRPVVGRTFRDEEGQFGNHRVAIVSDGFWKTRLGGTSDAIGATLRLNGEVHTVVGVLPEKFLFTPAGRANVWTPLAVPPDQAERRQDHYASLIGRLKLGSTAAQSAEELKGIAAGLAKKYPETNRDIGSYSIPLVEKVDEQAGNRMTVIIFGVTIGLLLIACSNVANLLLVRALSRRRQAAIQFSIGATRARLIRQSLVETLMLFVASALIGALAGWWLTDWISGSIPFENRGYIPNYGVVTLHWRVFAFTFGIALVTGVMFGLAPAFESVRTDVNTLLKESGSAVSQSRSRGWLRGMLVATQIALATILLSSTGLLVRSARNIWAEPIGFDEKSVLTFQIALDERKFPTPYKKRIFYERVSEQLNSFISRSELAIAQHIPFSDSNSSTVFRIEGEKPIDSQRLPSASFNSVTPSFFSAMRIPLITGRSLDRRDAADAPLAVVVSERFTMQFLSGRHVLGQRLLLSRMNNQPAEIVGVVADIRQNHWNRVPEATVYVPFAQAPSGEATVLLRVDGDPLALLPAIRKQIADIDREQPVFNAKLLENWINERLSSFKMLAGLATGFGALALALATVGLYGVIAVSVLERTREIGIRAALGAEPSRLLRMVLRQGSILLLIGLVPGVLAAAAIVVWLRSVTDVLLPPGPVAGSVMAILITVAVALSTTALAAILIPARRAASVDPLQAIRYE